MRHTALLVAILLAALTMKAAVAEPATQKVSVDYRDAPLRLSLEKLFKDAGVECRVSPNIPNVPVTLALSDVSLEAAARILLRVGGVSVPGLTLDQDKGVYAVQIGTTSMPDPPAPAEDARLDKKVTLDFQETPLRTALKLLLEGTGARHFVIPNVPNIPITARLKDVTVKQGLDLLLQQAYVTLPTLYWGQEAGVYLLGIRARIPGKTEAGRPGPDRRGSINIFDLPFQKIVRFLLKDTDLKCEFAPGLPDPKLTVRLREVTLEDALKQVMDAVHESEPDLMVEKKGNTYSFSVRAP